MSSIGANTFARMEGMVDPAKLRGEDITRPNVNGVAFWLTGVKGEPYTLTTWTLAVGSAGVETALNVYKAMQFNTYTVTNDIGVSKANQMVLNCKPVKDGTLTTPSDGTSTAYVICQWTMIDVSTS